MGPRQCLCERDEPSKPTLKCERKVLTFEEVEVLEKSMLGKKPTPKRPRKFLTHEEKVKVLDMHKLGWNYRSLAKLFGLGASTVRHIIKSEDKIRQCLDTTRSPATKQVKIIKRHALSKMEKALFVFIQEEYKKGISLHRQTIRMKAKALYEKIVTSESSLLQSTNAEPNSLSPNSNGTPDPTLPNTTTLPHKFKASIGWFYGFKTRYGLHDHKLLNEDWSANHEAVAGFPQECVNDFEGFTPEEQVTKSAQKIFDLARQMDCKCFSGKNEEVREIVNTNDIPFNDDGSMEVMQSVNEEEQPHNAMPEKTYTPENLCPGRKNKLKQEVMDHVDACDIPVNDNGSMEVMRSVIEEEKYADNATPKKTLTPENLCQGMRIATQLKQFFYNIDPSMVRAFKVMAGIDEVLTPYKTILDKMICKRSKLPTTRFFQQTQQSGIPASSLSSSQNPS